LHLEGDVEIDLVPAGHTYASERLSPSEVDERALRGLVGVVKIIHTVANGIPTFRSAAASSLSR
jgi:hypothetical protein